MQADERFTGAGFVRAFVVPALLLFAIPAAGYVFARYVHGTWDRQFQDSVAQALQDPEGAGPERTQEILAFYAQNPPSLLCAAGEAGHARLPPAFVSEACGDFAQVAWIRRVSGWSIGLGLLSLGVVVACGGLAFASRDLQYLSFLAGWNVLRATSALQVVAQGFVAVMLSFWLTVVFTDHYVPKLIALVGIAALAAVAKVLMAIFSKPDEKLEVEGVLLPRAEAPALWERINGLCRRLATRPADHLVGGIDDNFFVTEHPVHLNGQVLQGRTLFVSLSLLKRLDKHEADAVLAHEMAHFSGGDTQYSKQLSPLLARYCAYLGALQAGVLSRPIFYFMLLYWSVLQLALGKSSREREFRADRLAADLTSPTAMGHALCKVAAYSAYRARVEERLFERDRGHESLDIATSVATGFVAYARGPHLASDLTVGSFPHPFDSHPPLGMRLAAVGAPVGEVAFARAVLAPPSETWFSEIGGGEGIEAELWQAYQARFQEAHEQSLAFRYLPSTPEERTHVEQYFPTVEFAGRDGAVFTLDCEQLHHSDWAAPVRWADMTSLNAADQHFVGKVVTIHTSGPGGALKVKLTLRKLEAKDDEVVAAIEAYYNRYLHAKACQASPLKSAG